MFEILSRTILLKGHIFLFRLKPLALCDRSGSSALLTFNFEIITNSFILKKKKKKNKKIRKEKEIAKRAAIDGSDIINHWLSAVSLSGNLAKTPHSEQLKPISYK